MLRVDKPPVFQNSDFVARLDIHPVSPGHLLLIPKRHVARLADLRYDELMTLFGLREVAEEYLRTRRVKIFREDLRMKYQAIADARISKNSPWFIKKALAHPRFGKKPDGFNHVVNEGEAAGQTVMHLHWHVIPRFKGDVEDPSGGGRYVIPQMGNYTHPRPI
jgi:diadenosine tetraphosphate (Ap4A) HIT family hydrolase